MASRASPWGYYARWRRREKASAAVKARTLSIAGAPGLLPGSPQPGNEGHAGGVPVVFCAWNWIVGDCTVTWNASFRLARPGTSAVFQRSSGDDGLGLVSAVMI